MMNLKKNKLGYTLVEIVTTTAIIGALTAVAVPNFLRVKMNVNMEMAKQHLKVVGQEMNELYNQTKQFPASVEEIMSGTSPEEMSITASLQGIDNKGFDVAYLANEINGIPVDYTLRTDPLPGMFGIAGDKCLIVDSSATVREIDCWSGEGMAMVVIGGLHQISTLTMFLDLLSDGDLSDSERSILAGFFETLSMTTALEWMNSPALREGAIPAFNFWSYSQDVPAFRNTFGELFGVLSESGIKAYLDPNELLRTSEHAPNLSMMTVGFAMDNPVSSREEMTARLNASENYQAYLAYSSP